MFRWLSNIFKKVSKSRSQFPGNSQQIAEPQLIEFNRDLPFVRATFDFIENPQLIDDAVECLIAVEKKCGIEILSYGDHGLLWHDNCKPVGRTIPYAELLAMIRNEDREAFELAYQPCESTEDDSASLADGNVHPKWHLFFSETELLLRPSTLQDRYFFRFSDGTLDSSWPHRAWGGFLASWANAVGWHLDYVRSVRGEFCWDYLPFYAYTREILKDYDLWLDAVCKIIDRKSELLLMRETNQVD